MKKAISDSSLSQYLHLYDANRADFDSHSVKVMNRLRQDARKVLETGGLPGKGRENYEISSLEELLAPDFGINVNRVDMRANPAASFHCGVPAVSASPYVMTNDILPSLKTPTPAQEGLFVGSIRDFSESFPGLAEEFYGKIADPGNPLVALNTMLAQDCLVIYAAKGVKVAKPVQLVNILASSAPLMAIRRVLVIAGEDSEIKILSCDHTQTPGVKLLNLQTLEISALRNSVVDWCEMEESSEDTVRLSVLSLSQEEGSNVMLNGITLCNGHTRNEYHSVFNGPHASLKLYGMGIEDKNRVLDTYSRIDHRTGNCNTDELFKYVVDDNAVGAFAGLVLVEEDAVKTEAFQSNRNIVGSDSARMYSKPQLEIYNDDVKCSHGSATGQLNENQIFYMRTRGIPEAEARLLLKQAFMADVIDGVRIPALKERLTLLVEKRFSGSISSCASCQGQCETI